MITSSTHQSLSDATSAKPVPSAGGSNVPPLSHFLDIESVTSEQFWALLRLAKELKESRARLGQNAPILAGKSLAMIFS